MFLIVLGLLLWSGAHLFKRLAPARRAAMGEAGRKSLAITMVVGIVLMVLGYRMADGAVFWGRSPALVGINNLLMLLAVYLFAASGMKTAIARKMRHPMLAGVKVWALAHLLVNGDAPSFVLFGGMLVWAVVEMIVINRAEPEWTPPPVVPMRKEIMALVGTLVVYGVIAGIHTALGYPTFG
ncbi:NnrU protein [Roseovarius albus]|uniref:NnrU protein n=1 Tax=Roseovarius albus TaxID=1247867 RepID=A0A1X6YSC7_9RHOB|nr:NnrU family protein [Roseovarius albus]SLN29095.1 NnrU protein [Roseovarius albus]